MTAPRDDESLPSPCISICRMDPAAGSPTERATGGLCVGCLRTIDEIVEWASASRDRRRQILRAVDLRRAA